MAPIVSVSDVLFEIHEAKWLLRYAQIDYLKAQTAFFPWTRRYFMSAASDRVDAVNAKLTALDAQAPGAISAAIAAAAAGAPAGDDPALDASLTALEGTTSKLTSDLQAAIPVSTQPPAV